MQLLHMFHISRGLFNPNRSASHLWRGGLIALGLALVGTLSACSQSEDGSRSTRRAISQTQAIAADFLRTELALSPETTSRLRLERFLGPTTAYALDNHSQAGFERRRLVRIELLQRVLNRPRLPETHPLRRDLAISERALSDLIALEQLGYGRFNYAAYRPYAIDPYSGIWIEGPTLLTFRQAITTADQATAFLARLRSLSEAIQDTKRRIIADQSAGIVLPRQLAEETRIRVESLLAEDQAALIRILETFRVLTLSVSDLPPDRRDQLLILVETEIETNLAPAYRDLAETLADVSVEGADHAGIWAQPRGLELYAGIVSASLGDAIALERLHTRHLEGVAERRERLNQLLTLEDEALASTLPRPETLVDQLSWIELALTPEAEDSPPPATPLDLLNSLAPMSIWQRFARSASSPEQSNAIRSFQSVLSQPPYTVWRSEDAGTLPSHRLLIEYPAITSAWQHYASQSQLPENVTDATRLSAIAAVRIGLLQYTLAAVDTGIHLERWTILDAVEYLNEQTGLSADLATELSLTIAARPGYHTSIIAAWQRSQSLSDRARAVLGSRYSDLAFQKAMMQPGPRPVTMIEQDIEAWYGAQLSAPTQN